MPSSKSHLAEQKEPVLHQGDERYIGFMSCKNILKFFFLNLPSFFQTCPQQYQSLRPRAIPITIEMLQDSCWTGNWCNHHRLCKAGLFIVTMSSRSSIKDVRELGEVVSDLLRIGNFIWYNEKHGTVGQIEPSFAELIYG